MSKFHLQDLQYTYFLVTGGAGFIGSHLVDYLVQHQAKKIRVLDNLSTGFEENIHLHLENSHIEFVKGDISDAKTCQEACKGIDYVLHQAALGSVPRSFENPLATHESNLTGFLNMLNACQDNQIKRMVYASSSSVYGDEKNLPKVENRIGKVLSPYALTKRVNEMYAEIFANHFQLELIGLRYFNVFGPRQNPKGAYAAVIPKFMQAVLDKKSPTIHGDGEQTRDFTFIENVIQANIKALFAPKMATNHVYNIALGERISVNQLWQGIKKLSQSELEVIHTEPRLGDVRDSLADISQAQNLLGYQPKVKSQEGLSKTWEWFQGFYV